MSKENTKRHNQIMTAAAALFAKQGYGKTTVDEIVEKANVSKGLFYHYFKNKKELYVCLYNSYVEILSSSVRAKVDTSEPDFFERLRSIAYIRIDFITCHPNLWDFLYSAYFEDHSDIAPLIKEKNIELIQQSYVGSAANIDWSKLRKNLTRDEAIEMVTWVAEGFVRKIASASGDPAINTQTYRQLDKYIELLKIGMNDGE